MKELDKKHTDPARAAWLYYIEEFTQSQIAEKLGVSRSTVIRLLQRAKESGLVTISLGVSQETFRLERDLEKLFGLRTVRIVPEADDTETQRRWLGQVAAGTLQEMAREKERPQFGVTELHGVAREHIAGFDAQHIVILQRSP